MGTFFVYGIAIGLAYTAGQQVGRYFHEQQEPAKSGHNFAERESSAEYQYLAQHPMVQALRRDPNYTESAYSEMVPKYHHKTMVTLGTLSGAGLLTVEPLVFSSKDRKSMYIFYHVGDKALHHTKHHDQGNTTTTTTTTTQNNKNIGSVFESLTVNWLPSWAHNYYTQLVQGMTTITNPLPVVHTGLMTTLMDEGLSRCAFPSLPSKYGVTASLQLDFERPLPPNSFIVLRAQATKNEGRKSWAEGTLELLTDQSSTTTASLPLVEGRVLMVEPKWAKYVVWLFK